MIGSEGLKNGVESIVDVYVLISLITSNNKVLKEMYLVREE
jgi:hypothetical protein